MAPHRATSTAALIVAAVTLVTGSLVASACSSGSASGSGREPAAPSFLFVFQADDATLTPTSDAETYAFDSSLDCTELAECGSVVWFTDRPVRDSGTMPIEAFVALWSEMGEDTFRTDPPNVAIESAAGSVIATMSAPSIIRDGDGSFRLGAVMTVLPSDTVDSLEQAERHIAAHTDGTFPNVPDALGDVTLFIDPEIGLSDR